MRSPLVDPTRRASAHRDTQDPEAVVDAGPNEGYEAAVPPNAQATGAQAREAQAGTAQVAAPPARTESRPQPASEPLPQFMTPSNEATKTAKKGGLFAGLTGRLGRSAKTSDAKTPAAKTSEATAPSVNAPSVNAGARQRVVNGWQGGGPALQRPAGADPAQAHNAHAPDHQAHYASAGGARGPSIVHQPAHEPIGYGQPNETPNVRRAPSRPEAEAAHPSHRPAAEQPARDQTAAPHLDKRPEPTIPMPPPAPILSDAEPSSSYPLETNPVDSLIQSIANRLAAEREGVSTEELLALPAPYLEDEASTEGDQTQTEPLSTEAGAMARSVRAAVEAGRVEVHLQPILSLDGLATVSYEAFPRLKDEAGAIIKPSDYLSFAHRAGLNSGIEKLALLKAIHVLQQLDARGKLSPIFINVSQELLADGHFFSTFIEAMKGTRNLSHNLVLEFAQPIAAAFDERDLESLDTLSRLGFTFALDDVDHVEMDFEPLISRGLSFVKVSADVFRHGLIAGEALIPTEEIRLLFEDAGLQVIVHHISTEEGLDAALAQNVIFGQGNLFAEPKPIRAGVLAEAGKAA